MKQGPSLQFVLAITLAEYFDNIIVICVSTVSMLRKDRLQAFLIHNIDYLLVLSFDP